LQWFRDRCAEAGLPCTHQREVLYLALLEAKDHPSPEMLYERVKQAVPSISLATVYRNVKTFLDQGLISEVSVHHGSARLEANNAPHHHLVCRKCKRMFDLPVESVDEVRLRDGSPAGFRVERFVVEAHGICAECSGSIT
jgi:Fur family peroxide stress response transcriptional regulator